MIRGTHSAGTHTFLLPTSNAGPIGLLANGQVEVRAGAGVAQHGQARRVGDVVGRFVHKERTEGEHEGNVDESF